MTTFSSVDGQFTAISAPVSYKKYKLFLVEFDDDDRERVIAGTVTDIEVEVETDHQNVYSDTTNSPICQFSVAQRATVTMNLVPSEDGTLFRVEDFSNYEPEEDEDE